MSVHLIGDTTVQSRAEMVNSVSGADPIALLKWLGTSTDQTLLLDIKGLLSIHFLMVSLQIKVRTDLFLLHIALAIPEDKGEPDAVLSVM